MQLLLSLVNDDGVITEWEWEVEDIDPDILPDQNWEELHNSLNTTANVVRVLMDPHIVQSVGHRA